MRVLPKNAFNPILSKPWPPIFTTVPGGPEGGEKGGEIIAQGTVQDIVKNHASYTGAWLENKISKK